MTVEESMSKPCIRVDLIDGNAYCFNSDTHTVEITDSWVKVYSEYTCTKLELAINSKLVGCVSFNYKGG